MSPETFDYIIELVQAVRDEPEASTPQEHLERARRRYEWLHRASELIVMECMDEVRSEYDLYVRPA